MKLKKVIAILSAAVLTVSSSLAYFPSKMMNDHILTANAESSSPISMEGNIIWEPIKAEEIKETEDSWLYSEVDDEITIIGYKGLETELTLPSTIDQKTVTSIADEAFSGNSKIISIDLGAVKKLGNSIFKDCSELKEITIPKTVVYGGSDKGGALKGSSIEKVIFESGIQSIPDYICNGAELLDTVEFPTIKATKNGFTIGKYSFADTSLSSIELPENVTELGEYAFQGCSILKNIILPESLKTISGFCFSGCESLTELKLGPNVTAIGEKMIEKCTKIKELTIPSSVDTFYTGAVGYGCLCGSSVKKVIFEDGTRNIPGYICRDSSELENIVLPESVESIGESTFRNCPRIKTISLPENVESIGNSCFSDCTALESFTFNKNVKNLGHDLFNGCKKLKELTIPASVENVDSNHNVNGCLEGCGVETVTFEAGIKNIPHFICAGATQLKNVIIPEAPSKTLEGYSIGASAFKGTAIESIELPASLTYIGENAFEGCSLLKSISLPEGIKTLDKQCFKNCVLLTELEIPSSVTTLGQEMISGCNNIKYLDIPAGVNYISGGAWIAGGNRVDAGVIAGSGVEYLSFEKGMKKVPDYIAKDAKELKTVILPDTVTEIGNHAFENCTALKKVESSNSSLKFSSDTFMGCESLNDKRLTVFDPKNTYFIANTERGSVNGIINYKLKYDLLPSVISDAQSMKLFIDVPDGLTLMFDTIHSKDLSINTEDIQNGVIPVNSRSGEMEFSVRVTDIGNYKISASLLFESDKTKWNQPIGTVYVDCPDITIGAPTVVNSYEAEVYGVSQRDHDVEIFVNNKSVGIFRTNTSTGKYHGTISLPESSDGSVYTLYAKCGSLKSEEIKVEYSAGRPSVKKVVLKYGVHGNKFEELDITDVFTKGTSPVVIFQSDLGFDITTVNTDKIDRLFVTSQKGDDIKYIEAFYNAEKDLWSTEGNFDENDPHYVPGTLNIFILEKKDNPDKYYAENALSEADIPIEIKKNSKVEILKSNEDNSCYIADITLSDGNFSDSFLYYADDNASGAYIDNNYYTIEEIENNLDKLTEGKEAYTTIEDNKEVKYYILSSEIVIPEKADVKKAPRPLDILNNNKYATTNNDKSVLDWFEVFLKGEKGLFDGSTILELIEGKDSDKKIVKIMNRIVSHGILDAMNHLFDSAPGFASKIFGGGLTLVEFKNLWDKANGNKDYQFAAFNLAALRLFNLIGMPMLMAANPLLGFLLSWGISMGLDKLRDYIEYCMENGMTPGFEGFFKYITPGCLKWIWDPSGAVYDAASGEPLKDVTVTLYYLDPETGQSIKWDAEDYDQLNPLTTDSDGNYLWDVPEGKWKVVCHKDGYEDAESEWLDVPPIRTDVNISMTASSKASTTSTATATTTVTTTTSKASTTTTTNTTSKTTTTTTKSATTTTSALKTSTNTSTTTQVITTSVTTTTVASTTDYILGDVNNDNLINAVDASSILKYYALISTSKEGGYSEEQKLAADVDHDGLINAVDASIVLAYYAYASTANDDILSLEAFAKK
ncbi:Leucine rich repeat-containing protein [Ruminococcus flavefaciens]|uniref:Leucine rich repeat-containing protein n=1 Tax=Ruminococcus flavefaciens TaxID=1265 RepID=A0A1H6IRG5_RUMFL|nr:leucine-rich repeat protein [Ruminococcus flavefaciens]SEH50582.1 Leucine rich repeat-containing protein [Ruminococcus flavefaciens]